MGTNRKLPFGYRMEFGRIVIHLKEANWVQHIFTQYNQGVSFQGITDKMRNSGMPYDGDKQWNKNMIARILSDQRYCGDRGYPEIIDEETFRKVAEKRKKKSASQKKTGAQAALRKKCAGRMTPYIESEVLCLLNNLAMNPERIVTPQTPQAHSPRLDMLKSELEELISQLPVDESRTREVLWSLPLRRERQEPERNYPPLLQVRVREKEADGLQEKARAEAVAGGFGCQRGNEGGHGRQSY